MDFQFQQEKTFGGQELITYFQQKLDANIENKYADFKRENENRKAQFEVNALTINIFLI